MTALNQATSSFRNWKVKQYTLPLEMRLRQERAHQAQPPLMSLHAKNSPAATSQHSRSR